MYRLENFPEANEERKIEVVVHDFDVYSADQTLAMVILPVLRKLKDANVSKFGYYLADISLGSISINESLLRLNLARSYGGGTKTPS